ncbi:MAG: glycosyltransferase family 4 protein [Candidatus Aminicenantes bacterium]|nr:glycosyltransferase family 4 protein [Candidatus Aminicenantes bacterium]HHF52323.1 glycosyltransferase [Candidatus Aminicenantes bacterium]
MDVHQFATSLSYGDAISDEMLEIRKALKQNGYGSEIFIKYYDNKTAKYARDFREYRNFSSERNIVIFHFSIGSPVSKMFFRIPDKKVMIYHNITPFTFFLDYHRILARECYKGRLELKMFADKVDLALGDSEYNRKELEEAGYKKTGVLPLLLDLSKFDQDGDPVTTEIFDNGKKTLLFVGRVAPHKKFEDVIKVFYFYKKYFHAESQLILAGDYRGMEKYYAGLQRLIKKLELEDVHITGHVDLSELAAHFKAADIYLSMSEHEGFGVPLIEAFYNRVPVVAYEAGAVRETMNKGGVLVKRKEMLRIAALIDRINEDGSFRERLINGQNKALGKYRKDNVSRILMEHIREVLRK